MSITTCYNISTSLTFAAGAIFVALGGAIAFYFTKSQSVTDYNPYLVDFWIGFAVLAFACVGIALCPIPIRSQVPRTRAIHNAPRAVPPDISVTHYLDVAYFEDSEHYIREVVRVQGGTGLPDGLAEEMLRQCYRLARILCIKMRWIAIGFVSAGLALACVIADLGAVQTKNGWALTLGIVLTFFLVAAVIESHATRRIWEGK